MQKTQGEIGGGYEGGFVGPQGMPRRPNTEDIVVTAGSEDEYRDTRAVFESERARIREEKLRALEGRSAQIVDQALAELSKKHTDENIALQNEISILEKRLFRTTDENERLGIQRELDSKNKILKSVLEEEIKYETERLEKLRNGEETVKEEELAKIRAKITAYNYIVEDINHHGRKEMESAIALLENSLSKYSESYLASNPQDPDVMRIKGQLRAYRNLVQENIQTEKDEEAKQAVETVPTSSEQPKENAVKTFAKKAWGKVRSWFS